ncbi:MAG: crossover junction endodeoxyribonuclease RuvC [Hydrogenibacillus sp.]|nr:crossover junction endodeoxyribonuclease RuvC [Hydrogenibacillus sp.]
MRIIGIDPGLGRVGYGVIEARRGRFQAHAYGVIATDPKARPAARLEAIHAAVSALIDAERPEVAAVERLFFNTNVTTAMAVSEARGVILLALEQRGLAVFEYTPAEVKQAIAGYGRADKSQMQAMVRVLLGLGTVPRPDDAADALAVALAHAQHQHFAHALEVSGATGARSGEGRRV